MRAAVALFVVVSLPAWGHSPKFDPATLADTGLPSIDPRSGRPGAGAQVVSVTIDGYGKTDNNGPLHISYSDGAVVTIEKASKGKASEDEQEGFSSPEVAGDKQTVGWIEDIGWCCASYPLSHILDVFRSGRNVLHVEVESMILHYRFSGDSKRVAVLWSYPHGAAPYYFELFDLKSGKKIDEASAFPSEEGEYKEPELDSKAPRWARELERDYENRGKVAEQIDSAGPSPPQAPPGSPSKSR